MPTESILVVDDDAGLLTAIQRILRRSGYAVPSAPGPAEALAAARRDRFDLVLTDINMPLMTGLELLRHIRGERRDVAGIVITGQGTLESALGAIRAGAQAFVLKPFTAEELQSTVDDVLQKRRLLREVQELRMQLAMAANLADVTLALVHAVDVKDHHSAERALHISALAAAMADELGLHLAEQERLHQAALLQHVGMIGVRDELLRKTSPLTEAEREEWQRHPTLGAEILGKIAAMRKVVPIVLHHYEAWDGSGFPDEMAGERIPFGSRIISVCDFYDSLLAPRHGRSLFSHVSALAELRRQVGQQFDPFVADAFLRLVQERHLPCPGPGGAPP